MTNTAAIAAKLNVLESAIMRIEDWVSVMFVVVKGLGGRFISKKVVEKVEKMETVLERAQKIADCIGGKVWSNAYETRVYLKAKNCGYYVIGTQSVDPRNTKNASIEYMTIRDAGLLEYSKLQKTDTNVATPVRRRTSCLNCGITNTILMGRGYCTDCDGECN